MDVKLAADSDEFRDPVARVSRLRSATNLLTREPSGSNLFGPQSVQDSRRGTRCRRRQCGSDPHARPLTRPHGWTAHHPLPSGSTRGKGARHVFLPGASTGIFKELEGLVLVAGALPAGPIVRKFCLK